MKKFKLIGLMATLMVFAIMALGSGSTSGEGAKEITSVGGSGSSNNSGSANNSSSATNQTSSSNSSAEITIDEQVLFEQNGIKVTATEYTTDSLWGDGIKLLIENSSSTDLGVGCKALIVNDYMISDLFSASVAAGKKAYETLNLSSSALKAAGIENVGKIEVYFYLYDANSYSTVANIDCVTIKTSAFDTMDSTPNDAGKELYNANGIRIVGKYVDENSFWGTAVLLYIENNSGKNHIIQCDDLSVNGFMVTSYFSSTVYDGKKAIDDITLSSSDLKESNITSIDEIELKFKIIDEDYMHRIESDPITFSVN